MESGTARGRTRLPGPILVMSASAGTGHVRAGEALREACRAQGWDAEHVDVLELAPGWLRTAYGGGFELLARRAPRVWKGIYSFADGPADDDARWAPLARRVLFREFHRLLRSNSWAACVCTHFLPAQLAAGRGGHGVPFSLVVTDFELHRYWVQPRVSRYFVAHESLAGALQQRLPSAQVHVTGIPLASGFAAAPRWREARTRLGIPVDGRIAVLVGGGLGLGLEESVLAALGTRVRDLQLVVACGRNAGVASRLRALGLEETRLKVLDNVADMPALLAAADVVVTKPGGLTTSEALALGRPLVLTRAIPGHEEANARFLAAHGAALLAPTTELLQRALFRLFSRPAAWAMRAAASGQLGRPRAASDVATTLARALSVAAQSPAASRKLPARGLLHRGGAPAALAT